MTPKQMEKWKHFQPMVSLGQDAKGLVQLDSSLYSGWGFLGSHRDRQLKFSAYASFLIS